MIQNIPPKDFLISEYTNLGDLSKNLPELEIADSGNSLNIRFQYLDDYLHRIGTRSYIIEYEYIDRNFMEDYCGHYARCFRNYHKKCHRIHFFSENVTKDKIIASLSIRKPVEYVGLQNSYLGFIVLRPIAKATLGKVCLVTYPPEEGKCRVFPLLKDYKTHLFGEELTVRSLAYQEQDRVISACATASLWSAFHAVREKAINEIPSPYNITENARKVIVSEHSGNVLDKGLYPSQIASAIREEGLDPIMVEFRSISYTKALVRAYLNLGLPVIFGMQLRYQKEDGLTKEGRLRKFPIGGHATTVTGYNLDCSKIDYFSLDMVAYSRKSSGNIKMISSGITKFYVHDDQIGPFASMISRNDYWQHLETRWNYYQDKDDPINATLTTIFIPCYCKVRIRFATVWEIVTRCNILAKDIIVDAGFEPIWDIRLTDINEFKREVRESPPCLYGEEILKFQILKTGMPRFLWIADCYLGKDGQIKEIPSIRYVFDATDMPNADLLVMALHPDLGLFEACVRKFRLVDREGGLKDFWSVTTLRNLLDAYLRNKFIGDVVKIFIADHK